MRKLWRATPQEMPPLPRNWVFRLRTNRVYRAIIHVIKRHIAPFVSAVVILYCSLTLLSHLLFNGWDSAGFFCRETPSQPLRWLETKTIERPFKVNELCWASGVELTEGQRYLITIKQTTPWMDSSYESEVGGFEIAELPRWTDRVFMFIAVPLRRVFLRPWFRPIARIGSKGTDEYFLDPDKPTSLRQPKADELDVAFRARRSGELFLYVNDAVVGLPGVVAGVFFENNKGEAQVTIKHLARRPQGEAELGRPQ
jgi:hypothetical protein